MTKKIFIVALLLNLTASFKGYCGWPTRPGRLIISPSISFFTSNRDWDSIGHSRARNNNGTFSTSSISLYTEYGLSRRWAVLATVPYISYTLRDSVINSYSRSGLGDAELSLKYYLANIGYRYYFTLQGTAVIPMYSTADLGYAQTGGELRLGFSGSGKLGDSFYSISLENGVRKYSGTNGPLQDRYSVSFGITLDKKFHDQLTVGASGLISKSDVRAFTRNIYTARDYSFTQVNLSYGHSFNSRMSLFLTASRFIIGRNTGVGTNGSLAFIYRFDNAFSRRVDY